MNVYMYVTFFAVAWRVQSGCGRYGVYVNASCLVKMVNEGKILDWRICIMHASHDDDNRDSGKSSLDGLVDMESGF